MNDNFGNIASDFLPDGFGDSEGKLVQPLNAPHPDGGQHIPPGYGAPAKDVAQESSKPTMTVARNPAAGPTSTSRGQDAMLQAERQAFWGNISGIAKNNTATTSRRLPPSGLGNGGYWYYQNSDNSVQVYNSANKNIAAYPPGSQGSKNVIAEFGAFPTSASGSGSSAGSSKGKTTTADPSVAAAIGAGLGQFTGNLLPSLASLLGPQAPATLDPGLTGGTNDQAASGPPWGMILGGVVAVVVVGGIAYFATRPSPHHHRDEDED